MLSPSKDKIGGFYDSLQAYFNIEADVELKKYLVIYLTRHPYG